ncbi:hypothetical protein BU631_11830, partial [Staphylococcus caprae]
ELTNLKSEFDLHFRLSFNWGEKEYLNFIFYLYNKSDFKQIKNSLDEILNIFKTRLFTDRSIYYLELIDESLSELILFFDKVDILTPKTLGENWLDLDHQIRINLISLKQKTTLINYIYTKKGIGEELFNLLSELFDNFTVILKVITDLISNKE